MTEGFYRAFEDRYRGSRELIKGRLGVYRAFIDPIAAARPRALALDLGCGRGEWLEVLSEAGFDARGVDLDAGMLQACAALGLRAEQADALETLARLPDASVAVVSAFHVVEHIPFDALRRLVDEARRVLQPGGLLILETPNPENLVVGSSSFYLDPTHVRPIPPPLLSFVVEYHGYARVKTLRLQESPSIAAGGRAALMDVLGGVSPDYAVVGQKGDDEALLGALAPAFDKEYGVTPEQLAARYDARIDAKLEAAETRALQSEARAQQSESRAQEAEQRARQAESRAQESELRARQAEDRAQRAEDDARELRGALQREADAGAQRIRSLDEEVRALRASSSWRLTAPLRAASTALRVAPGANRVRDIASAPVDHAIRYVSLRPGLKRLGVRMVRLVPPLEARLRERRAAQVRADFVARTSRRPGPQGGSSDDGSWLAHFAQDGDRMLTTDEILARIRKELEAMDAKGRQP